MKILLTAGIYLMVLFNGALFSEKLIDLPNLSVGHFLTIGKNQIYIMDNKAYRVSIYSKKSLKLITKFGRKGQGPGEFNDNPGAVFEVNNRILVFAFRKVCVFNLTGEHIRDIKTEGFHINPTKTGYVLKKNIFDNKLIRAGIQKESIIVLDAEFKEKNEIFNISSKKGNFSRKGKPGKTRVVTFPLEQLIGVEGDRVVYGNANRGLYFKIFDSSGNFIKELNLPYEKLECSKQIKEHTINEYKKAFGSRWKKFKQKSDFIFPSYLPPFTLFKLADQKIYIYTHKTENQLRELIVFDLQGKKLGKFRVPYNSIYKAGIKDGNYYYFVDNDEHEMWELHIKTII